MRRIKKFFQIIFYPYKESLAILSQIIFVFILIGSIDCSRFFINQTIENKYSYINNNIILENSVISSLDNIKEYGVNHINFLNGITQNEVESLDYSFQKRITIAVSNKNHKDMATIFTTELDNTIALATYSKYDVKWISSEGVVVSNDLYNFLIKNYGEGFNNKIIFKQSSSSFDFIELDIKGIYTPKDEVIQDYIFIDIKDLDKFKEISIEFDLEIEFDILYNMKHNIEDKTLNSFKKDTNEFNFKIKYISNELETYTPIFNIIQIFIYIAIFISMISYIWLILEKFKKLLDSFYIRKIFYEKSFKIMLKEVIHNATIIFMGFILITLLLMIFSIILKIWIGKFVILNMIYYFTLFLYLGLTIIASSIIYIILNKLFYKNRIN